MERVIQTVISLLIISVAAAIFCGTAYCELRVHPGVTIEVFSESFIETQSGSGVLRFRLYDDSGQAISGGAVEVIIYDADGAVVKEEQSVSDDFGHGEVELPVSERSPGVAVYRYGGHDYRLGCEGRIEVDLESGSGSEVVMRRGFSLNAASDSSSGEGRGSFPGAGEDFTAVSESDPRRWMGDFGKVKYFAYFIAGVLLLIFLWGQVRRVFFLIREAFVRRRSQRKAVSGAGAGGFVDFFERGIGRIFGISSGSGSCRAEVSDDRRTELLERYLEEVQSETGEVLRWGYETPREFEERLDASESLKSRGREFESDYWGPDSDSVDEEGEVADAVVEPV